MKRMKQYFAIMGVMFFIKGLAFAQDTTLTVTSAGNVGIGTNNPAFLLDIFGTNYKARYNSGGNVDVLINRASDSNFGNLQYASDGTLLWAIGLRGVSAADGLFFHDEDAGTTRMMIDGASGNVGIATTAPNTPLHINGTGVENDGSTAVLRIVSGNGAQNLLLDGNEIDAIADGLFLNNNTGENVVLANGGGNVGIGTTNPQGKLDVNGSIFQRGGQLHADYVFEPDYQLESIEEHAEFMWKYKHLKAIPKAKVDENGREIVEVGAHRKGIVEELEKAHIYIDRLHNRINTLEATLEKLAIRLDGNN